MTRRQRKEARDLVRFIEAHGGKLGAFRGYRKVQDGAVVHVTPSPSPERTNCPGDAPPRPSSSE